MAHEQGVSVGDVAESGKKFLTVLMKQSSFCFLKFGVISGHKLKHSRGQLWAVHMFGTLRLYTFEYVLQNP